VVDDYGNALLCGFAFSRIRHEITRTLTMQQTGGALRFLAPELASGISQFSTEASDIYALAMTFFALSTLCYPFADMPNAFKAMIAAQHGERPRKPDSLGGLSPDDANSLWSLLEIMWHHRPTHRPSARSVEDQLAELFFSSYPLEPAVPVTKTPSTITLPEAEPSEARNFIETPAASVYKRTSVSNSEARLYPFVVSLSTNSRLPPLSPPICDALGLPTTQANSLVIPAIVSTFSMEHDEQWLEERDRQWRAALSMLDTFQSCELSSFLQGVSLLRV
jgi:hypothetical protein